MDPMILSDLLAQTDTTPTGPQGPPAGPVSFFFSPFFGLTLLVVVFYVFLMRGQGRKRKETEDMLKNLKKNDRVMTTSGILGNIMAIKGDEILVKVDETTNTRLTFIRTAIQRVVTDEPDKKK